MSRYPFKEAEAKWQKAWADKKTFEGRDDDRPTYYVLEMFPYPSGLLHMGHVRNYTLGDVVARYKMAKGFNVMHPMGWDAFGLPAENAAITKGIHPAESTYGNIEAMKKQFASLGLSLDWSREFATCDPSYYRHQQAMFLDFLEAGLAYRKESSVNWDPVDHTVLANEQVVDGRGWRSGAVVERRKLAQWFFRVTEFADELLEALEGLDRWPDKVRTMQERWIGRSEGALVGFEIEGQDQIRWRSSPHARIRCSAPASWRLRPITPWPRNSNRASPSFRLSSPNAPRPAPARRRSSRRRSWASTPAFAASTHSSPISACRSMSPISC